MYRPHHVPQLLRPVEAAAERRREQSQRYAQEQREARLRARRLAGDPSGYTPEWTSEHLARDVALALEVVRSHLSDLSPAPWQSAVGKLATLLSLNEDAPAEAAASCGAAAVLLDLLQRHVGARINGTVHAGSIAAVPDIVRALQNLAAAGHSHATAVMPAVPTLLSLLGDWSQPSLVEHSASTLGNLAGDCCETRKALLSQGALQKLAAALLSAQDTLPTGGRAVASAYGAVAWALAALIKDCSDEAQQLLQMSGVPECLMLLQSASNSNDATLEALAVEATWLLATTAAGGTACCNHLSAAGAVGTILTQLPPLTAAAVEHAEAQSVQQQLAQDAQLLPTSIDAAAKLGSLMSPAYRLVPLLLALRHLTGTPSEAQHEVLMAMSHLPNDMMDDGMPGEGDGAMAALLTCISGPVGHRGVLKEATACVAALAAAGGGRKGGALVRHGGFLPPLANLLVSSALDIRKHAASALLAASSGGGSGGRCISRSGSGGGSSQTGSPRTLSSSPLAALATLPRSLSALPHTLSNSSLLQMSMSPSYRASMPCTCGGDLQALRMVLAAGDGGGAFGVFVGGTHSAVLAAMVQLLHSIDPDAARIGLHFVQLVLQILPRGAQAVEAEGGIDALEHVERTGHPHLQMFALELLDEHFGTDYGLEDERYKDF